MNLFQIKALRTTSSAPITLGGVSPRTRLRNSSALLSVGVFCIDLCVLQSSIANGALANFEILNISNHLGSRLAARGYPARRKGHLNMAESKSKGRGLRNVVLRLSS